MKHPKLQSRAWLIGACSIAAIAVVVSVAFLRPPGAADSNDAGKQQLMSPPHNQLQLLHAERFRLDEPYQHRWRADVPFVTDGWLLVLSGDPELLRPRQVKERVLYVGAETAERINTPPDGKVVVLVPGDFRLDGAPIFLGAEALPEELMQPQIDAELAAARAAGVTPPNAEAIAAVLAPTRTFANDYYLRLRAIELVEQHSPTETDLIAGARVPLVK
jgi:hypothetical protein